MLHSFLYAPQRPINFDGVYFSLEYTKYNCHIDADEHLEVNHALAEKFNEIRGD